MPIVRGNNQANIAIGIVAETDKASFDQAKAVVAGWDKEDAARAKIIADAQKASLAVTKAQEAAQNKYRQSLTKSREEAEKLAQIGNKISMAGALMLAPFIGSMAKFAVSANKSDAVANQYRDSMASLENSTVRLGRATADALNPILKETASIVSDIVGVLEKNPALLDSVLAVGGAAVIGGQIVSATAGIKGLLATAQLLSGATGAGSAAAAGATATGGIAAFAAAAAPVVITALLAAGVVAAVSAVMEKTTGKNIIDVAKSEIEFLSRLPEVIAGKISAADLAAEVVKKQYSQPSSASGLITPAYYGNSADRTKDDINAGMAGRAVQEDKRIAAEAKANEDRLKATEDFEAKKKSIEQAQTEATHSYLVADKNAWVDYYNSRSDTARAAGIEAERAEEDHQRAILKIQRDSDQRIYSLRLERDALGIVQEKRNAETQRKEAEENYRIEVRRKNQDLAEKFRIMDREFSITNQRRLAEYQYNMQIKNAEVAAAQQMYNAIIQIANAAVAAVNGLAQTTQVQAARTASVAADRYDKMNSYADGGDIARTGPAFVHRGELMVNRQNRQIAENLIGGNLSQASLLDALRSRGGRATINNNFGGTVTISQVLQMLDMSSQAMMKTITRSIEAA